MVNCLYEFIKFKQFGFKEQYKLLYLALMEAFSGPSRCVTTEKFVGAYQEQTCYANRGDVVQKSSQSSEFEVIETCAKEIYEMMCSINQTGDFMYVKGVHVANYNIA